MGAITPLLLCACAEDPPPTVTIRWSTHVVSARYFHNQSWGANTALEPVSAVGFGRIDVLCGGTLRGRVDSDPAVFVGPGTVAHLTGNDMGISLQPDMSLPPGTYSGVLTVHLYEDGSRTCPVINDTIPYELTVDPELTITATVDGTPVGVVATSSDTAVTHVVGQSPTIYWLTVGRPEPKLALHGGEVLALEASVPVAWVSPDQFWPWGGNWSAPVQTSTTLVQTVPVVSGDGVYVAMPLEGDQYGAGFVVDVAP